jgi:exodeoxyribonuclease VIII
MNIIHNEMKPGEYSPGIYDCYSNAAYHAHEAISKSDLDLIHKSPAHYKYGRVDETPAMRFGSAFHCAVLERERFDETYCVIDGDKRTKSVKDALKDAESAGKVVLTKDEMNTLYFMRESVLKNPLCVTLIENAMKEYSVFSELDGVRVKCRPDGWVENRGIILDLKSTDDASPDAFSRTAARFRYHVQDAFYRNVLGSVIGTEAESIAFVFIAVEKTPPFGVALYCLDELSALQGWVEAREDMRRYRSAVALGKWFGYSQKIESLSLPRWALSNV